MDGPARTGLLIGAIKGDRSWAIIGLPRHDVATNLSNLLYNEFFKPYDLNDSGANDLFFQ